MTDDAWISSSGRARQLGVNLRTVYGFIDRGELVAYKVGKCIRVRDVDLRVFLSKERIQPGELDHLYPERKTA